MANSYRSHFSSTRSTSTSIERTLSVSPLSSVYTRKPGQFPDVHLRKTEIKYSPRRNTSISSVRIAQPERLVFQANSRSNILRAASLLIPSRTSESFLQTSRVQENGIDSPTEAEMGNTTTKDVLGTLKETSRKRNNNEKLEVYHQSEVDTNGLEAKRARTLSVSSPTERQLQTKRLCSKNNDISSSLSSSTYMNNPKRMRTSSLPGVLSSSSDPVIVSENPADTTNNENVRSSESSPLQATIMQRTPPEQPRITLFNKKYDESFIRPRIAENEDQYEDDGPGPRINFIKPKAPTSQSDSEAFKREEKQVRLALILSCLTDDNFDHDQSHKKVSPVSKNHILNSLSASQRTRCPARVSRCVNK